jgi:hypothetical protein
MRPTDLSLKVSQRKQACVLDPALLLAHAYGPALALQLTQVLEPWLTRSFWQVIDASELLQQHHCGGGAADLAPTGVQPDAAALTAWITLRDSTDASSWPLRWVGDNLAQSQIGDDTKSDVVERYEHLAYTLTERAASDRAECDRWSQGMDPMFSGMDTIALSATLGGALVLSVVSSPQEGDPWPVQAMALARLNVRRLDPMPMDTLFAVERKWVRDALVSAGAAPLSECLPRLAVVHAMVDAGMPPRAQNSLDVTAPDPWASAQGWWYLL